MAKNGRSTAAVSITSRNIWSRRKRCRSIWSGSNGNPTSPGCPDSSCSRLVYYGSADLVHGRPQCARHFRHHRDPYVAGLDRHRLGDLRSPVQFAARQQPDHSDAAALCDARRDELGLHADLFRPRRLPAPRRLHRDDHDGQCVLHHHAEPADRRRRPQGRPHARPEIRQDRQAAFDAQQLPDPAGRVPDAVEPLSAGVRHRVQLGHRLADLHHRRADPALLQHRACRQRQPLLDLAGRRRCSSSSSSGCRPCRRC